MTEGNTDERLRALERESAANAARLEAMSSQQSTQWQEVQRLSREFRDEAKALREESKSQAEQLMTAINTNKLAWSMMNSGTKVAAWIILALASIAGAISAVVVMVKKVLT